MKFIHISDLHLGKRIYETSLIEDQKEILNQILNIIDEEKPNGLIIAGDVYDKSIPTAESVAVFDAFISKLVLKQLQVFIISGNHDSAERIAFGAKVMDSVGIHFSPVYGGEILPIKLNDEYGEVNVYMLPFIKPSHVRRFYENEEIKTYTDAVKVAIEKMNVDKTKRNILVSHQYVQGALYSGSEETIGGLDSVDVSVFSDFDYVALGHLHSQQYCRYKKVRYSGTPLKYSFSECNDVKSITVVTINNKDEEVNVRTINLKPIRDMKVVRGEFSVLINQSKRTDDYVHIILTDEDEIPNAMDRLRVIYSNALTLKYDNTRTRLNETINAVDDSLVKSPYEMFCDFYKEMNNAEMSDIQKEYMKSLVEKITEGEQ